MLGMLPQLPPRPQGQWRQARAAVVQANQQAKIAHVRKFLFQEVSRQAGRPYPAHSWCLRRTGPSFGRRLLTRHQRLRCGHGEAFLLTRAILRDPFPGRSAALEWLRIVRLPIADGALPYLMMGKKL